MTETLNAPIAPIQTCEVTLAWSDALSLELAHELGIWFPQHAQTMNAALAFHLRRVGYDAETGIVSMPEALP